MASLKLYMVRAGQAQEVSALAQAVVDHKSSVLALAESPEAAFRLAAAFDARELREQDVMHEGQLVYALVAPE